MLHGHPITSFLLFQAAFIQSLSSGLEFPEGFHRERYIQMLDACSLRRPHIAVQQEFLDINRLAMRPNEAMETFEEGNPAATDQLVKWKKRLKQDENWISRRARVMTDVVDQHKDRHPDHLFLIVDEKLQLEYNGRLDPVNRHFIIKTALEAKPPQAMLATRATGGQSLNIRCFNAVGSWHSRFRRDPTGSGFLHPKCQKYLGCYLMSLFSPAAEQASVPSSLLLKLLNSRRAFQIQILSIDGTYHHIVEEMSQPIHLRYLKPAELVDGDLKLDA
ncbi:global transactivator [Fusarium phyllophilum]|uniref:Global transactivator n=1 Tax=Fusarium phyllophilum TaxID=47803 RepID=A0A8H5NNZ1_9HYPO|nr:global transactivator [Fusarium phyllophilum]